MWCKSSTVTYCGVIIYYCITYPGNSAAQQLEEEGKSLFCVQEILQSSKKKRTLALLYSNWTERNMNVPQGSETLTVPGRSKINFAYWPCWSFLVCTRTLHQIFLEHVPLHSSENRKELYYKTFSVCVMDLRKILKLFYPNILSFPKKAITIDKKLWISAWKTSTKRQEQFLHCISSTW